jgi:hypothetical protein
VGDRANILVKDGEDEVHLYSHWMGSRLPNILQHSMKRGRERWDDPSYLARIIFCDMVDGYEKDLTGFGISNRVGDGDNRIAVVDVAKRTITISGQSWSFQEFADLKNPPTW